MNQDDKFPSAGANASHFSPKGRGSGPGGHAKEEKLSPKRAENLSFIAFIFHFLAFLALFFLARPVNALTLQIEAWHFLGGVFVWLMLLLQFRQRRLAEEERLDAEEYRKLKREGKESSVFGAGVLESSLEVQGKRLRWMEKWLIPIFAAVQAVYLVGIGCWLWFFQLKPEEVAVMPEGNIIILSAFLLAGLALISFLFSQYAVGMSRESEWRPLRAGGSYLFSNALACVLLAGTIGFGVITKKDFPDQLASIILICSLIIIGAETVFNLVLDAFTPRIKGRYRRAPYESRLLGLFSEPGGIMRSIAHALDYQFGFKVSETWFYRLLERAVVPLIIVQVIVLYLMTSITIVPAGHVGVLERFGRPINLDEPFTGGMHLKLPALIDEVRTFPVSQVQMLEIGFERGEEERQETALLWSVKHWEEEYPFMVAVSGENVGAESLNIFDLLVVPLIVHYRINDVEKYGYGENYGYTDPGELLESICYRETLHYCAQSDLDTLMGPGRNQTTKALREAIQERADEFELGVEIVFAGLETIHPPVEVASAFEEVVGALQEKQAKVLEAMGKVRMHIGMAEADRNVMLAEAQAYASEREQLAAANSERFRQQIEAYERGGSVYLTREYLSVLEERMPELRKYIISAEEVDRWVYEVDLKEKLQPDLFGGLGLPEEEEGQ